MLEWISLYVSTYMSAKERKLHHNLCKQLQCIKKCTTTACQPPPPRFNLRSLSRLSSGVGNFRFGFTTMSLKRWWWCCLKSRLCVAWFAVVGELGCICPRRSSWTTGLFLLMPTGVAPWTTLSSTTPHFKLLRARLSAGLAMLAQFLSRSWRSPPTICLTWLPFFVSRYCGDSTYLL
jgi:hypothetical protein